MTYLVKKVLIDTAGITVVLKRTVNFDIFERKCKFWSSRHTKVVIWIQDGEKFLGDLFEISNQPFAPTNLYKLFKQVCGKDPFFFFQIMNLIKIFNSFFQQLSATAIELVDTLMIMSIGILFF